MTGKKAAVIDACALYPAPLRDALLGAASLHLYQPYWSDETLVETTRNLVADGRMNEAGALRFVAAMRKAFPGATITTPSSLISEMPTHPDDRHVAAVAAHVRAGILVTFNLRHFPAAPLKGLGITVLHPDQFLCELFDDEPFGVAEAIRRQQAKLSRPPQTMDQVLATLATMTPQFVALIRPLVIP